MMLILSSEQAEDDYCDEIWSRSGRGQKFASKCTPGYYVSPWPQCDFVFAGTPID